MKTILCSLLFNISIINLFARDFCYYTGLDIIASNRLCQMYLTGCIFYYATYIMHNVIAYLRMLK